MVAAVNKVLELKLYKADLQRCEEAIQRQRPERAEIKTTGIYPEAQAVVGLLAGCRIREEHWSTVTTATIDKIAASILSYNAEAGVGSPDNPQVEKECARRSR